MYVFIVWCMVNHFDSVRLFYFIFLSFFLYVFVCLSLCVWLPCYQHCMRVRLCVYWFVCDFFFVLCSLTSVSSYSMIRMILLRSICLYLVSETYNTWFDWFKQRTAAWQLRNFWILFHHAIDAVVIVVGVFIHSCMHISLNLRTSPSKTFGSFRFVHIQLPRIAHSTHVNRLKSSLSQISMPDFEWKTWERKCRNATFLNNYPKMHETISIFSPKYIAAQFVFEWF